MELLEQVKDPAYRDAATLQGLRIKVSTAAGRRCIRCWTYGSTVGATAVHPALCARCSDVVERHTP